LRGRHRSPRGERHGNSKVTASQVIDIRQRAFRGETLASISRLYRLSDSHVSSIVRGDVWSHLPVLGKEQAEGKAL
jgi:Mor family transcriptional regulator